MNEFVKTESNGKSKSITTMLTMGETENDYLELQTDRNDISEIIDKRKNDYNCHLASELNNLKTSAKTY